MLFANAAGYRARICVTVTRAGVIMQLLAEKREIEPFAGANGPIVK